MEEMEWPEMSNELKQEGTSFGKRLASLHFWNALLVSLLVLTGLIMYSSYWREVLGEAKVGIKWLHIMIGLISFVPLFSYLRLLARHWKLLKGKYWQRVNVIVVPLILLGWFISGIFLWQFQAVGPEIVNASLLVHDLLTWIGLPLFIYHSISRQSRLRESKSPRFTPERAQPFYSRKAFIRTVIGAGLTISLGPSLIKWISNLGSRQEQAAYNFLPVPQPLPESAPPIGGGAIDSFRSYSVTRLPFFTSENWSFTIDGLVEKPVTWNWEQFVALKRSVQVSDFHCVTGWSVYKNTWEGLPLKELLERAQVKARARVVKFHSGDGVYTDSLTLSQADMDDVIVAVLHDGKPIPNDLGGPVRLIIPKMYAYKSVKWLNRIELIEEDHIGYWGELGYEHDAWITGKGT